MHSGSPSTPDKPAYSLSIGIAALIIEGRPLFDDEYVSHATHHSAAQRYNPRNLRLPLASPDQSTTVPHGPQPVYRKQQRLAQTLSLAIDDGPPITTSTPPPPYTTGASDSVQHLERLRQKLNQIRSLPSTSRDSSEQSVTVNARTARSVHVCISRRLSTHVSHSFTGFGRFAINIVECRLRCRRGPGCRCRF